MFISFLGSLPLGTMNVTATNITAKYGTGVALVYSLGSMIVEIIYVRIALVAMTWIQRRQKIFRIFEWFTLILILLLAVGSFIAAIKMSGLGYSLPSSLRYPFLLGALLSATNPLHIPFWFGWSTVLINKNILQPDPIHYNWYVTGIGLGTMAGFTIFIYGGSYLIQQLKTNQNILNWVIGIILLVTVLIQLYKMKNKPALVLRPEVVN